MAGPNTWAPWSARPTASRKLANSSRPVPKASWCDGGAAERPSQLGRIHQHVQRAGVGVEPHDVAVAQPGDRPAVHRLGRHVDRRRDAAGRAGHAAVGEQRDLVPALLQHAERRRQRVQLGHAVGRRALVADDHDHVAVELAGRENAARKPTWSVNTRAGASITRCSAATATP